MAKGFENDKKDLSQLCEANDAAWKEDMASEGTSDGDFGKY